MCVKKKIKLQQGKWPRKKKLEHSMVSAREKKLGHSRVSEKQDNTTSDTREKKKLGRSRVSAREKKIKAQQGKCARKNLQQGKSA